MIARFQILFLFLICLCFNTKAQSADSLLNAQNAPKIWASKMWNLDITFSGDLPSGDLAKRFGRSYRLGVGMKYKTERNYIFGFKGEFILGNQIRDDSLLINVKTNQGGIINIQGELLNVGLFERGYLLGIQVGKIFPVLQINNNSGPMMLASLGFMQHKIKMYDRDNSFPQINGEYRKGYDRLTNGVYIENFIGYAFYSKNKLVNFYAGFDFVWGFTQGRRDYLYDVARTDKASRNDILMGFKLGWVLPIYKKNSEEIYY